MIIGLGSDLCNIERIEKSLDRFGDRFVQRCFTEIEQAKSERRRRRAESYAKRFAAKCHAARGDNGNALALSLQRAQVICDRVKPWHVHSVISAAYKCRANLDHDGLCIG